MELLGIIISLAFGLIGIPGAILGMLLLKDYLNRDKKPPQLPPRKPA